MKLEKKKALAARALGVGKGRIVFNNERLAEIKQAITKQDIRDLTANGAIKIREIKGSLKVVRRTSRRRAGSVKIKVSDGKRTHMTLLRSLRSLLKELRKQKRIVSKEHYHKLRKEARAHQFKSKAHLHERVVQIREK